MKNTALTTGAAALILAVGLAGHFASGAIYSSVEARDMISALSSPALYLGSTIAASASTTLALMLTLLDPRRSAFFMARSVLRDIRDGGINAGSTS